MTPVGEKGDKGDPGVRGPAGPIGHKIRLWPWVVLLLAVVLFGLAAIDRKTQRADDQLRDKAAAQLAISQHRDGWARYNNGIDACKRGNIIRAEQRAQAKFQITQAKIFQEFLTSSAAFRRASGQPDLALESLAAKAKLKIAVSTFHPPQNIICEDVIAKPLFPDPDKPPGRG